MLYLYPQYEDALPVFCYCRRYAALEAWALVSPCPLGAPAGERLLQLRDAPRGEGEPRGTLVQPVESPRRQCVAAVPAAREELAGLPQEAVKETIRHLSQLSVKKALACGENAICRVLRGTSRYPFFLYFRAFASSGTALAR